MGTAFPGTGTAAVRSENPPRARMGTPILLRPDSSAVNRETFLRLPLYNIGEIVYNKLVYHDCGGKPNGTEI